MCRIEEAFGQLTINQKESEVLRKKKEDDQLRLIHEYKEINQSIEHQKHQLESQCNNLSQQVTIHESNLKHMEQTLQELSNDKGNLTTENEDLNKKINEQVRDVRSMSGHIQQGTYMKKNI